MNPPFHNKVKSLQIIALLLLSIGFLSALLLSFNKFGWADDYSFQMMLKNNNVFGWAWDRYFTFDGRHLTLWGIIQGLFIKLLPIQVTISFYYLSFALGIAIISKTLLFQDVEDKKKTLLFVLIIILSFLIVFRAHAFETIYWAVGGMYSFMLLGFSIWYYLLTKIEKSITSPYKNLLFYILSFSVGSSTQNLAAGILFIILFKSITNKNAALKPQVISFILVLTGALYISLAPGNATRGLNLNTQSFAPTELLGNFQHIIAQYLKYSKSLFLIAFSLAIALFNLVRNKSLICHLNTFALFGGTAIATILPFTLAPPELASIRTAIFFQFFLSLGLLYLFFATFQYIGQKVSIPKLFYQINTGLLIILISIVPILNFYNSFKLKKEFKARETFIIQNIDKKHLSIPHIKPSLSIFNYLNYFKDITDDPEFWRNQAFARYYGYESAVSYEK